MDFKLMNVIGGVTAALALVGSVIAFDARYAKEEDFAESKQEILKVLETSRTQIINEMRQEVVKNRSVMIDSMQREADDLEYQMMELEKNNKDVPRYMSEKYKQILRQIEALKDDTNTN